MEIRKCSTGYYAVLDEEGYQKTIYSRDELRLLASLINETLWEEDHGDTAYPTGRVGDHLRSGPRRGSPYGYPRVGTYPFREPGRH